MYEETKDNVAKVGSSGVGIASTVGTVSVAGAVGGLSATGITSGLAAIGGVVGGGMVAGVVITAAAPIAIGGAVYGLYKWLSE